MPHYRIIDSTGLPHDVRSASSRMPDPELDAVLRIAVGLDVDDRGPLEAEVMLWRICSAKSIPDDAIRRALSEEWESQ